MVVFVFLNGNGVGEGKYLFVYIKIFFGEYDNILEWSFILLISFSIYDQNIDYDLRVNIIESFVLDSIWKYFQKSVKDIGVLGFGYFKFVFYEILKIRDYIKDDSIIIKVKVDSYRNCIFL